MKIIVIEMTFTKLWKHIFEKSWNEFGTDVNRSFGTEYHPLDLRKLECWEYSTLSVHTHMFNHKRMQKNIPASILTFRRTCKFQDEFVIVIVIDSKKKWFWHYAYDLRVSGSRFKFYNSFNLSFNCALKE